MASRTESALTVEIPQVASERLSHVLWRYRWIITSCVCVSLCVGGFIAGRTPVVFESSSRLLFQQTIGSAPVPASPAYVQSQVDLLQSAPVLNNAAIALAKLHLKTFGSATDLYGLLTQSLKVTPGATIAATPNSSAASGDGTLAVFASSPVASDAAVIVNTVVNAYRNYQAAQPGNPNAALIISLNQKKDALSTELTRHLKALKDFQAQNSDVDFDSATDLQKQKLSKLNEQLTEAEASVMTLNASYDSLLAQYGGPSAPVPSTDDASSKARPAADESDVDPVWIQNELSLASANLDVLRARGLADDSPSVRDVKASIAHLNHELAVHHQKLGLASLAQTRADLDVARRHAVELQTAFDAQNNAVIHLNARRVQLANLQDEVRRTERSAEETDSQLKQVHLNDVVPMQILLLDEARPASAAINTTARHTRNRHRQWFAAGYRFVTGTFRH